MKNFREVAAIFVIGETAYSLLELFWRGHTHWTMSLTGGFCFLAMYQMNQKLAKVKFWKKCLIAAFLVTTIEFSVGCLVNRWLKWEVWNYASHPLNFLGQICLFYSCLWFLLSIPALGLCTYLKRRFFNF